VAVPCPTLLPGDVAFGPEDIFSSHKRIAIPMSCRAIIFTPEYLTINWSK
jgi:hypothetical protein